MSDQQTTAQTLDGLVRSVITDHPDADPVLIAEMVAKLTEPDQLVDFLALAVVHVVHRVIGSERRSAMDGLTKPSNRSAKRDRIRSWWTSLCESRVNADELQFCIESRQTHIARVQTQINNYEHLIGLLIEHGVATVAELPAQEAWAAA